MRREHGQDALEYLRSLFDRDDLYQTPDPEDAAGMGLRPATAEEIAYDERKMLAAWDAAGTFKDRNSREWVLRLFANAVLSGRYPAPGVLVDLADRLHSYCSRDDPSEPLDTYLSQRPSQNPKSELGAVRDFLYAAFIWREKQQKSANVHDTTIPAIATATGYSESKIKKVWERLGAYVRTETHPPSEPTDVSFMIAADIRQALWDPEAIDCYTIDDLPKKSQMPGESE